MTPEHARLVVERERRMNPDVVTLARHLALATVIELELVRAMRLLTMPEADAGVEADLYFSPMVLARDASSMEFYPEIRTLLHDELRTRQNEMHAARAVIEQAHDGMDAAILIEESVAYYALRDDPRAYQKMQEQLGSVVKALAGPDVDDDLLWWVDRTLETFPRRALRSEAGKELSRFFDNNVVRARGGTGETLEVGAGRAAVSIGCEVRPQGVRLRSPAPTDWLQFQLPGPLPVRVTVESPVSGGWNTQDVPLDAPDQMSRTVQVPLGLIRFRGDGGDEIRIRPVGPYQATRPRLLLLHASAAHTAHEAIETELDDLEWQHDTRPLRRQAATRIFVSHSAGTEPDRARARLLTSELRAAGLHAREDTTPLESGSDWAADIGRAVAECRAAVVLLSRDALMSDQVKHEASALAFRRRTEPDFELAILLAEDVSAEEVREAFSPILDLEVQWMRWESDRESLVARLSERLLRDDVPVESIAGILMDFETMDAFDGFVRSLHSFDRANEELEPQLDRAVRHSLPLIVRVAERFGRVSYDQVLTHKGDDPESPATRTRWVADALRQVHLDWRAPAAQAHGEPGSALRALLLDIEARAIARWQAAEHATDRAATLSDPPHAMVMIQWDRWYPSSEDAPRRFDYYRSGRKKLTDLVGDGGTLWVVTSREVEGRRRYQIAYRLKNTRTEPPTAEDERDNKRYRVRAAADEDVTHFPIHDATDTLLDLSFMAGTPADRAGEIGSTLNISIPHLTVGDVDVLESVAEQLVRLDESRSRLRWKIEGGGVQGHQGTVRSIAMSADGSRALTAGNSENDQTVKLWNLDDGTLLHTFENLAAGGGWTPMAIDRGAQRGVAGFETEVRVLDLQTGQVLANHALSEGRVTAVSFVGPESVLAGTSDGGLFAVNVESGSVDELPRESREEVLRIDADDGVAACLRPSLLQAWDLREAKPMVQWQFQTDAGAAMLHSQRPPLSMSLATGSVLFGSPLVRLDVNNGIRSWLLDPEQPFEEVTEAYAISGGGGSLTLWDVRGKRTLETIDVSERELSCVAVARNGRRMMVADYDHHLYVWDLPPIESPTSPPETEGAEQVAPRRVRLLRHLGESIVQHARRFIFEQFRLSSHGAQERAEAGRALARLGDPRPEVMTVSAMELCSIPAGEFVMGSQEDDGHANDDERPAHSVRVDAFRIGRYPVTNAQFAEFVRAGGYEEEALWSEAREGMWSAEGIKGWADDTPRTHVARLGDPFDLSNHPVVGLTWYEVLAFARWVEAEWRASGKIEPDDRVTLPTEAEWEYAARGRDGRRYPWGSGADPDRANYADTQIGSTSAVGCFPGGASPHGVEEMSGNVWEWTRSIFGSYPDVPGGDREEVVAGPSEVRVLRGGAFHANPRNVRCAYRHKVGPENQDNDVGFRVVVLRARPVA